MMQNMQGACPKECNKTLPYCKVWLQLRDGHRVPRRVMKLSISVVVIILGGLSYHCIQLSELPHQADLQLQQQLLQLLKRIRLEQQYDTILIYGSAPCVFHEVLQQLELPTVLLAQGSSHSDWDFSSEPLLLSCGATAEQEQIPRTLLKLQHARRLVYLEAHIQPQWLCEDYSKREQHNVAMLDAQFATSGSFYSCRFFQQKNHVPLMLHDSNLIYVQQFRNMQGAIIRSEADQLAPRSMLYRDAQSGNIRMMGYVADLLNTFAQRVNATLHMRDDYVFGKTTFYGEIDNKTRYDLLDVATILVTTALDENLDYLSYPYILTSYCIMAPVPAPMPFKEIFTVIVSPLVLGILLLLFIIFSLLLIYSEDLSWREFSLTNILLNDRCLRGLLGQSFPLPDNPSRHLKAICFLICFASLLTTTMYASYLNSFFTHPPMLPYMRSFDDIRKSSYKVAVQRREANMLLTSRKLTTDDISNGYIFEDFNDFVQVRDTFNVSYVYPVTELRWETYEEQQRIFENPVFYYSEDICFYQFVFLCVPMRFHLPYRQLFEEHMLYMKDFGMLQFWMSRSFYDMVRLRLTPLEDYSIPRRVEEAIQLQDLTWIFGLYIVGHLLACFCFVIELCRGKVWRVVPQTQLT